MKGWIPVALGVASLLAAAPPAHAQFTVEGTYPTGSAPYNVYAADFNGDGRPDLVTSDGDGQTLSVYLRQPGGGFAAEAGSPFQLAGATSNGALADFNGDTLPDLAIADFIGSGVVVALRAAGGGFTRAANVPLGGQLSAVGAGDFNQDGLVDLAVAEYNGGNVSIMLRNAGGGFALAPNGNYFVGAQPRQIAVADFNGDERQDVAVANRGSGSVSVLINGGAAAFTIEPPVQVGGQPTGITAGDLDGDGRPDLAVSNFADDTVSILLRSPLGGFTQAAGSPVAVGDGPVSVTRADFDGDGAPEIAVAVSGGSLDLIGRGFARVSSTPITVGPYGVAAADFNGDGRPDAAVSSLGANLLTVLLSPSPQPPPPPPPQPTPTPIPPENPQVNREVNVVPVSGTVRIRRRGATRFEPLTAATQIQNGSTVDARDGRVTIVAAQSRTRLERADFFDGLFRVSQSRRLTTLTLAEALDCRRRASAAQRKPKTRKLWGDGKGRFRTKGQYSAATIRGTVWLVQDGCRDTRTRVRRGSVTVRDAVRKRTIVLRAPRSYTARPR